MIEPNLAVGKYVVAVSGGVDSVVLLDVLTKNPAIEIIAAHFDHGIRPDSKKDRLFVEKLAKAYGVAFEFAEGKLGADASEQQARSARYGFLKAVVAKHHAEAIVTAHHQDDVLETLCINLMRGTGRKGLSSLQDTKDVRRPFLNYDKKQLIDYAKKHGLIWQEDSTNQDEKYLRNWVRSNVIPKLTQKQRQTLIELQDAASHTNKLADELFDSMGIAGEEVSRGLIINVDHKTATEIVAHWLRSNDIRQFDAKQIERIVIAAKTLSPGKKIPVYGNHSIDVTSNKLILNKT